MDESKLYQDLTEEEKNEFWYSFSKKELKAYIQMQIEEVDESVLKKVLLYCGECGVKTESNEGEFCQYCGNQIHS